MNHPQRSLVSVIVSLALALLACSPLGGAASTAKTATPAAPPTSNRAGTTATPAANAATATVAAGGAATEAASATAPAGGAATDTEAASDTATPTYDAISAQLTVPPLLTANAATATAATGSLRQWALAAQASSQYGDVDWAATQATGAPNSPAACGDNTTAWASAGNSGQDNLELVYTTTVVPVAINIYEGNGPGSIVKVDVEEANGTAHTVYTGQPLVTADCPRIFSIGITSVTAKVNRIKIYVDQSVVKTWDEIDAVELVGNP